MLDVRKSLFFNSLPVHVQESVMQSGIGFDDEEHLRRFAVELGVSPRM